MASSSAQHPAASTHERSKQMSNACSRHQNPTTGSRKYMRTGVGHAGTPRGRERLHKVERRFLAASGSRPRQRRARVVASQAFIQSTALVNRSNTDGVVVKVPPCSLTSWRCACSGWRLQLRLWMHRVAMESTFAWTTSNGSGGSTKSDRQVAAITRDRAARPAAAMRVIGFLAGAPVELGADGMERLLIQAMCIF